MTDLYKETLEAARTELDEILNEETRLEARLVEIRKRTDVLRKTVNSLVTLVGEDSEETTMGITDAIRKVLKDRPKVALSPVQVRGYLRTQDFPIAAYKNVLAVIHTTLRRLEEQEEVKPVEKEGKTYYCWIEREDDDIPF